MMRPRGKPPIPTARSRPSEPDGITSICSSPARAPIRMIEPFPKARSICAIAASSALFFSIPQIPNPMTAQVRFEVLHVKGIYLQPTRVKILSRFFVRLGSCLLCSVTTSQARALNDQGSPVVTDSGKHKAEDNRPIAEKL